MQGLSWADEYAHAGPSRTPVRMDVRAGVGYGAEEELEPLDLENIDGGVTLRRPSGPQMELGVAIDWAPIAALAFRGLVGFGGQLSLADDGECYLYGGGHEERCSYTATILSLVVQTTVRLTPVPRTSTWYVGLGPELALLIPSGTVEGFEEGGRDEHEFSGMGTQTLFLGGVLETGSRLGAVDEWDVNLQAAGGRIGGVGSAAGRIIISVGRSLF